MSARVCERDGCEVEVTGRSVRCPEHQAEHRRAAKRENARAARTPSVQVSTIEAVCNALNDRQRAFVREYMIDLNATQAYIRAGYSPKGANAKAARLIANDRIQAELRKAKAEAAERNEVNQDDVIQWLLEEATNRTKTGSAAARVRALELLGKHLGMWPKAKVPDVVSEQRLVLVAPAPVEDETEWGRLVEKEVGSDVRRRKTH